MKNYYQLKMALQVLNLPRTNASRMLLNRAVSSGKIKAKRKNKTKYARMYYHKGDIQKLANQLDALPRDGRLVGEVAQALGISTVHVLRLRKQGRLKATRDPISGYWVFSQAGVERYIRAITLKPTISRGILEP